MNFVVGSGPSGVMAALALLERGQAVTMLDVGRVLEADRFAAVRSLGGQEPEAWDARVLERIRGPVAGRGLPLKRSYGSEFPYAKDEMETLVQEGTRCLQSFAKGGLSNVWGAALLPALDRDMNGWPVTAADLAPHYAAAARAMPVAGERDDLETLFPYHQAPSAPPRLSRQAENLLEDWRRHREPLRSAGFHFGRSRLAVRTEDRDGARGCRHCGLCLSGCPYFAIWSSAEAVEALQRRPGFTYRPGALVTRVQSLPGSARLYVRAAGGRDETALEGSRVFLACGAISTAKIALGSLGVYGREFTLQFQPYFLLPLLARRGAGKVGAERLHTLAQLYLEILDEGVSAHPVHLQVYTYNEFIRERVRGVARWLGPLGRAAGGALESRLLAIQGYLHSSESRGIALSARRGDSGEARLTLRARPDPAMRAAIRRAVAKLSEHSGLLGARPLAPFLTVGQPGDGNHIGGLFPMRSRPGEFETDSLGQLPALPRVHLVDGTALTDLPSTTFTYTLMANAHRIAAAAADADGRNG